MKLIHLKHLLSVVAAAISTSVLADTQQIDTYSIDNDGAFTAIEVLGPRSYRVRILPNGPDNSPHPFYPKLSSYSGPTTGTYNYDMLLGTISFTNDAGDTLLRAKAPEIARAQDTWTAKQTFTGADDEILIGTGQYQDGYLDVKGLSRRLTQVNTQIAIPMLISNKGYGILWNNTGLTEYNPADNCVALTPSEGSGETTVVDVTGTSGNKQETRHSGTFTATINVPSDGEYSLLLDCGQSMARKHYLEVDGNVLAEANNLWLPPTTSVKTHLDAGKHTIVVKGNENDHPVIYWRIDDGTTTFASPVSQGIDYTVFIGSADEIIAEMRRLTGQVPMMPRWAFGYVHCRERYDTQAELLENAKEFRQRNIPIDLIVQDWQWWGDNGWNAMKFDTRKYPDPKAMTDSLHAMDMRIMLSVWAKVDKNSTLGKEFVEKGYYIPDTDWIDFFSQDASEAYWTAYRDNLLPTGIDAWWQDATEPENDDLHGRVVAAGAVSGDAVRNIFPIAVNDRVYTGLSTSRPDTRPMILTRSGAPGIQRYGVTTWSGDVGNGWQTLKHQITGALGQMACGLPWWTYDAGGFFRPADQYSNREYQQRMIRWIQNATFLPLMRVHGYMSQTEPWRYDDDTYTRFIDAIKLRYRLVPYLYSEAQRVSAQGSTLMRPMLFDYPDETQAAKHETQYMLGSNLLVCPVTGPENIMYVYLPNTDGGWYELTSGRHHKHGGNIKIALSEDNIPVFVKAGAILPWATDVDNIFSTTDLAAADNLTIRIYPGADGEYLLYDDDGVSNDYRSGAYCKTRFSWDNANSTLTIDAPEGDFASSIKTFTIVMPDGNSKTIDNKATKIKLK